MIGVIRMIRGAVAMGLLALFVGCGPSSHVSIKSLGVERPLISVSYADRQGAEVYWAVGDNSSAFRPALYAPYPGPRASWCVGLYLSRPNPTMVYVWHVQNEKEFLVYELQGVAIALSGDCITGHGEARVLRVNHDGEVLEGLPSPATASTDELTIVLRRGQGKCGPDLQTAWDQMRPIAEKFLFRSKR